MHIWLLELVMKSFLYDKLLLSKLVCNKNILEKRLSNGEFFAIRLWPRYFITFCSHTKKYFTKLHRNSIFLKDNPSLQQFLGHFCRIFYRRSLSFRLSLCHSHLYQILCLKCLFSLSSLKNFIVKD